MPPEAFEAIPRRHLAVLIRRGIYRAVYGCSVRVQGLQLVYFKVWPGTAVERRDKHETKTTHLDSPTLIVPQLLAEHQDRPWR
jgi:hypothetical protein